MAPSAATGATGLERLLLIFLMKTLTANLHRNSRLHHKPTLLPRKSERAAKLRSHRLKLA